MPYGIALPNYGPLATLPVVLDVLRGRTDRDRR
jgi:hypothetical protein